MQHFLILALLNILSTLSSCTAEGNNVCRTFQDYYLDRNNNDKCYFNPDTYLEAPDIIRRHGYPVEIHNVTTQDGYILTLFRIPYGKTACSKVPGVPVFMQHGFLSSSMYFYFRGNKSLGFVLADQGYDVWFGNFRGNRYSNKHKVFNTNQSEYWNFSFHEMGIYDLPAQLDLIGSVTKKKIVYIGYSMGTTTFYVYNSVFPDAAFNRVRLSISLAPVAFMQYITTPIKYVLPLWPIVVDFLYSSTNGSLIRRTELSELLKNFCFPYPNQMTTCMMLLGLVFGYDGAQLDPEYLPVILSQSFDAASLNTVTHYIQIYHSGKFRHFDYGRNNKKVYGTMEPPKYQLSNMKVPNYLIRAKNDFLATKENVELLYSLLPQRAKPFPVYTVKYNKFCHSDFMGAKDTQQLLYDHIISFLEAYLLQFS